MGKHSSFEDVIDGKAITMLYRRVNSRKVANMNFCCCDCGLVHNIAFVPWATRMKVYMWRDNRRTANRRRRKDMT